jgi:hypothetical protein
MIEVAELLSHTLGEEESADYLLNSIAKPLLQQATIEDAGGGVKLEGESDSAPEIRRRKATVR